MKKYLLFLAINNLLLTPVISLINPLTYDSYYEGTKLIPIPSIINEQVLTKEEKRFNISNQDIYKHNFKNWSEDEVAYLKSFERKAAGDITDINCQAVEQYKALKNEKHFTSVSDIDLAFSQVKFKSADGKYVNTSDVNLTKIITSMYANQFNIPDNISEQMVNLFNFLWGISPQSCLELFQHFIVVNSNFIDPFDDWIKQKTAEVTGLVTLNTLNNGEITAPTVLFAISKYGFDQRFNKLTYNVGVQAGQGALSVFTHEMGHAFDLYYQINKVEKLPNWNALSFDNPNNFVNVPNGDLLQKWYKEVLVDYDITKKDSVNSANLLKTKLKQKITDDHDLSYIAADLIKFINQKFNLPTDNPTFTKSLLGTLVRSAYSLDGDSMHELTAEAFARWVTFLDGNTPGEVPTWSWSVLNEFFLTEFTKIK